MKNLLTFSRSGPMNPAPTAIHMIIDQVIQLVQHKLDMTGIQLQLDLAPDLPPLKCDAAQMEQVLLALVSNATDAMPRGGNLWLRTRLLPDAGEIEIQVRDDGSGIPPEILSRIFEPFVTTKESGHGVGLGLAVSHSIVERHRGTIAVQSELGRGTTFTVWLTLYGHDAELASAAVSAAAKER